MKKLLSILAIGGGILGSTLPTITACNQTGKFYLNNIQLYNLDIYYDMRVNRNSLLHNISLKIMAQYNSQSFSNKLKVSDFMYGTKPTKEHPWAIEVMNIDGKTPLKFLKGTANLIFPPNYTVLTDNALKVKITTTNQYANTTTATVNGYLGNFIYTNANLNQGHDLKITNGSGFVITGNKKTVFDISQYIIKFAHDDKRGVSAVIDAIQHINDDVNLLISKKVFTALNNQLKTETKTLNDLKILKTVDPKTKKLNFGDQSLYRNIYWQRGSGNLLEPVRGGITPSIGDKLFARFSFNNSYGPDNNHISGYVATPNTYLYLYLGETT